MKKIAEEKVNGNANNASNILRLTAREICYYLNVKYLLEDEPVSSLKKNMLLWWNSIEYRGLLIEAEYLTLFASTTNNMIAALVEELHSRNFINDIEDSIKHDRIIS